MQTLVMNELDARGQTVERASTPTPCDDATCAQAIAAADRVAYVIVGGLQPFGGKILVTASVYRARDNVIEGRHDLSIDTASDLDVAAKRIASAVLGGGSTEDNQELGAISQLETQPDKRRQGDAGFTFSMGGIIPARGTYGGSDGGLTLGVGYWYEGRNYALETAIGFRFSADTTGEHRFYEIPLDVGAYYILGLGNFAPFIGAGGGLRWMNASRRGKIRVGSVIELENEGQIEDDGFGFGAFARLGVMLLRTYSVRMSIAGRYSVNFWDFNGNGFPQAGMAEIQVHF